MTAKKLIAAVEDEASVLPHAARQILEDLIGALSDLEGRIGKLDAEIRARAQNNEMARRLMTIHSPLSLGPMAFQWLIIGPLIATALVTLAPPAETFRRGRDFAVSGWKHASGVTG